MKMKSCWIIAVYLVALTEFTVGIQDPTDCQAVREEFEVGSTCRDVYRICDDGYLPCNVTALCSNECRDLYERMQRCNSSDPTLIELRNKVNLMCGVSTEHNTSCITLFPTSDYSYKPSCSIELLFGSHCSETCRDKLALHSSDCCIVNQAIIVRVGQENETLHTDVLWSKCNVTSPGRCPNPPPPVRIAATPTAPSTATALPTQTVGNPSDEGGASSTEIDSIVFLLSTLSAILYLNFFTL